MLLIKFPFKYYSFLPDSTLATKIREESWKLDALFPAIKKSKSELERLGKSISSNTAEILKAQGSINRLAEEIREGFIHLKLINFYDSTILYLYYRLLQDLFSVCRMEESRLIKEVENAASLETELNEQELDGIKKAKNELEKKIAEHEKIIKELSIDEKDLLKAYTSLVKKLRKLRWSAEKQAQHESSPLEFTLRGMENLSKTIKTLAINVKKEVIPEKARLMEKIREGEIQSGYIAELARLSSKAIENISKDVSYSSKLISKFEKETASLKSIVEILKRKIDKLIKSKRISEEAGKQITKPWEDALYYLEKGMNKDLMQIFRNVFVEYKYVGTRELK